SGELVEDVNCQLLPYVIGLCTERLVSRFVPPLDPSMWNVDTTSKRAGCAGEVLPPSPELLPLPNPTKRDEPSSHAVTAILDAQSGELVEDVNCQLLPHVIGLCTERLVSRFVPPLDPSMWNVDTTSKRAGCAGEVLPPSPELLPLPNPTKRDEPSSHAVTAILDAQ
ncbi:hypothetical protein BaRGS_00040132, partial [Batillaria attramentaria]